jgi:HD-GYP domain-containing protein (c-di-GMP phosphodiesterase class II)
MFPSTPLSRRAPAAGRQAILSVLEAAASLGREEQPELYRHVHPHAQATARLARSFATALGCFGGARALDEVELGAHLHDFGKYLIAKSILLKPGPLSERERAAISRHPVYGAQLLSGLPEVTDAILRVVLHHHERWDGDGYPDALRGARIPLAARLVSVVDVYTSLRARRSYKPPLTKWEASAEMERMAGRELDPALTRDFLKFIAGY